MDKFVPSEELQRKFWEAWYFFVKGVLENMSEEEFKEFKKDVAQRGGECKDTGEDAPYRHR